MLYNSEQQPTESIDKPEPSGASTPGPHRWKPGESGNPRGRPRKGGALTDAIRRHVDPDELIAIALKLAREGEAESTRMQALAWLRDSGYLRPAERHEIVARAGGEFHDDDDRELDSLPLDQCRALLAARREFEERRAAILDGAIDAIDVPALPAPSETTTPTSV